MGMRLHGMYICLLNCRVGIMNCPFYTVIYMYTCTVHLLAIDCSWPSTCITQYGSTVYIGMALVWPAL